MVSQINFRLSQVVKALLLGLMLVRLVSFNNKNTLLLLFLGCVGLLQFFYYSYYSSIGVALSSLNFFLKFYFWIVVFYFCKYYILKNKETAYLGVKKILNWNFVILIINLLLGVLGFGYATYTNSFIGAKGFFYAGNELSGLYLVLSSFFLFKVFEINKKYYYIYAILVFLLSISISTKVVILGIAIFVFLIPKLHTENLIKLKKNQLLTFFIIIIVGYIFYQTVFVNLAIYERWVWFYNQKFGEQGLGTFILSGRNIKAANIMHTWWYDYSISDKIFGVGVIEKLLCEMDLIDTIHFFGLFGVSVIYLSVLIIFFNIIKFIKDKAKRPLVRYLILLHFMIGFVSVFAGHILYSAVTGVFLSILSSTVFIKEYKKIFK